MIIVLFGLCTEYDTTVFPEKITAEAQVNVDAMMARLYPFYQDVHVMIFIGFGFLMVFLKTHCWTSVGLNFLIAAFSV